MTVAVNIDDSYPQQGIYIYIFIKTITKIFITIQKTALEIRLRVDMLKLNSDHSTQPNLYTYMGQPVFKQTVESSFRPESDLNPT